MTTCAMDDCPTPARSLGLCPKHYARQRRNGDPLWRNTAHNRFWSKVEKTDTCWLWTGAKINGYGTFRAEPPESKQTFAHRWAYEQVNGPIPDGLTIDHLCRVKHCVRPDHLEAVTQWVNTSRGFSPPAVAQRTNQCVRGHSEWYTYPDGRRHCRVCQREAWRRYDAKRRQRSG